MEQENINIFEILAHLSLNTTLYSPVLGYVSLLSLGEEKSSSAINVASANGTEVSFNRYGKMDPLGEVLLFPDKEERSWQRYIELLKPHFELGKLYVFNEEDEDNGQLTIIGQIVYKNESQDELSFGNQYEVETGRFVTDEAFILRISAHKELREATQAERAKFCEAQKEWKKSQKKEYTFKIFDKVLVRDGDASNWVPALYVRKREESNYPHEVLVLNEGNVSGFAHCIPFENHEHIAFTIDDEDTMPS